MDSNDNLKEIDVKNGMCCYFDDITKIEVLIEKNHAKLFWFILFHTKPWLMQNHCVLGTIK